MGGDVPALYEFNENEMNKNSRMILKGNNDNSYIGGDF